jgi:hypothetical protein
LVGIFDQKDYLAEVVEQTPTSLQDFLGENILLAVDIQERES